MNEILGNIVPDKNTWMGLIMSTESMGLDGEKMDEAFQDWEFFYKGCDYSNFNHILCHLICKADVDNLVALSKGFPEHIRIFAEKQILALTDKEKEDSNEQ